MLIRTPNPQVRDGLQADGVEASRDALGRHFGSRIETIISQTVALEEWKSKSSSVV